MKSDHAWWRYLNRMCFQIRGPHQLIKKVTLSLDEGMSSTPTYPVHCKIEVNEVKPYRQSKLDLNQTYFSYQAKHKGRLYCIKHIYYGTHVRTIVRAESGQYYVTTHLKNDETAVLLCVRDYLLRSDKEQLVVHSALVRLGNIGILIAGPSGCGKSTIALILCQTLRSCLIADEDVVLKKKHMLRGLYLPRAHILPLRLISMTPLASLFHNLEGCGITQIFDEEWLRDNIRAKRFGSNGKLCVARLVFSQLAKCRTDVETYFQHVIFPVRDRNSHRILRRQLSSAEIAHRLGKLVRSPTSDLALRDLYDSPRKLPVSWMSKMTGEELRYGDIQDVWSFYSNG